MSAARLVAGLIAALLVGPLVAPAAVAQDGDEGSARLVVTGMPDVLGPVADDDPGDDDVPEDLRVRMLVENDGEIALSDLEVVIETYGAVEAPSVLTAALDDRELSGTPRLPVEVEIRDGEELGPGEITGLTATVPGERAGWAGTNGVYPVRLSLQRGTEVLDQVVTAVVHLVDPPSLPLETTVVWPLAADPQRTAQGTYPDRLPDDLAPGGRLDLLLYAAERHTGAPIVFAPDGATFEELADRADGFTLTDGSVVEPDDGAAVQAARLLARARDLLAATPLDPVAGPYAEADVSALASGPDGVHDLALEAITTERTRVQTLLERAPSLRTHLATTQLTPLMAERLPAEQVLLPESQVRPDPQAEVFAGVSRARRCLRAPDEPSRCTVDALVAAPGVTRILADPPLDHGTRLARQRLIAETAMLYLTEPGAVGRALLALPPEHWEPNASTVEPLLSGLLDAPWLSFDAPTDATDPVVTDLATAATSLPGGVSAALVRTRRLIDALREATPTESGTDPRRIRLLQDALLRAVTPPRLDEGGAEAIARLEQVARLVEEAFGTVSIIESPNITLTSDTGDIPVTLERISGPPIEVLVEVTSTGRLVWDEGAQTKRQRLSPNGVTTLSFTTQAVSRGTFPVDVSVWDPSHTRLLDTARLSVRSTAISRPALIAIGVVVVALLVAGSRRRRRPRLEVVE